MKNLKIVSILALIITMISMIGGIGIANYYVDNLVIRGGAVFILIMSSYLVSNVVRLVFKLGK